MTLQAAHLVASYGAILLMLHQFAFEVERPKVFFLVLLDLLYKCFIWWRVHGLPFSVFVLREEVLLHSGFDSWELEQNQ
jgi:formate-dependent nitrite reductase membrane component NrfD